MQRADWKPAKPTFIWKMASKTNVVDASDATSTQTGLTFVPSTPQRMSNMFAYEDP